jgi:hypothetical protein
MFHPLYCRVAGSGESRSRHTVTLLNTVSSGFFSAVQRFIRAPDKFFSRR